MDSRQRESERDRPLPDDDAPSGEAAFETRLQDFAERIGTIARPRTAWNPEATSGAADGVAPVGLAAAPIAEAPVQPAISIEAYARRQQANLLRAVRRASRRADDEAVHDVRVAARRIVAMLRVWRELFRRNSRRQALRALRRLRRALGETRELEVHAALINAYRERRIAEPGVLELAGYQVQRRLDSARRRAAQWTRGRATRDLIAALDRTARRIATRSERHVDAHERASSRVLSREHAALTAVRAAVEGPDNEGLHGARIEIKKWRYAIEALSAAGDVPEDPRLGTIREVQEALGVVQDRSSLRRELLPEEAFLEAPEPLAPVLEEMERERQDAVRRFGVVAPRLLENAGARAG